MPELVPIALSLVLWYGARALLLRRLRDHHPDAFARLESPPIGLGQTLRQRSLLLEFVMEAGPPETDDPAVQALRLAIMIAVLSFAASAIWLVYRLF